MGLKSFIINEELRLDQAERFVRYKDKYNTEVFIDIKEMLTKAWMKDIKSLATKYEPSSNRVTDATLRNPTTLITLSVVADSEKLLTARSRDPIIIAPSCKVPLVYDQHERDRIITKLLETAEQVFTDIAERWKEIFTIERNGRAVPWFRVIRDHDESKFQLTLSIESNESYKTLYTVRVEYGKIGSKSKDFDRVYLVSLL